MSETRDRGEPLLAVEKMNEELRADYQRRLAMMLEQELSRTRRISLIVVTTAATLMGGLLAFLLLTERLPWQARLGFGVGIVFALAWIVYCVRILARGTFHRKTDATTAAYLSWGFTLLTGILFAVASRDLNPLMMFGFLFILPAGLLLLRTVIEQSELRTQERLLELEYRIAKLGQTLAEREAPKRPER